MAIGACRNRIVCAAILVGRFLHTIIGRIRGFFTGKVKGHFKGKYSGSFIGRVIATGFVGRLEFPFGVHGHIEGVLIGTIVGPLTGSLVGTVFGELIGNVIGRLTGPVIGTLTGKVIGNLVGVIIGHITGVIQGSLSGELVGATLNGGFTGTLNGTFNGTINGVPFDGPINQAVDGIIVGVFTGTINGVTSGTGLYLDAETGPDGLTVDIETGPEGVEVDIETGPGGLEVDIETGPDGLDIDIETGPGGVELDITTGEGGLNVDIETGPDGVNVNIDIDPNGPPLVLDVETGPGGADFDFDTGDNPGDIDGKGDFDFDGDTGPGGGHFDGDTGGKPLDFDGDSPPSDPLVVTGDVDNIPTDPGRPNSNTSAEEPDRPTPAGFPDLYYPPTGDPPIVPPPGWAGPPGAPPGGPGGAGGPTDTGHTPTVTLFSNADQTCTKTCHGNTVSFTTVAGMNIATTQAQADSDALKESCKQVDLTCNLLPPKFVNVLQNIVVACTGGGIQTYTVLAGDFTSTLSQAEADQLAIDYGTSQASVRCDGVDPVDFSSTPQTCEVTCTSGAKISVTTIVGVEHGATQAAADAAAYAYACKLADLVCVIVNGNTFANTDQTCILSCGSEFTVSSGEMWRDTQVLADQAAYDFACEVANLLCPLTTPDPAIPPGGNAPPGGGGGNSPPVIPAPTEPPSITYSNSIQVCQVSCGDGGIFKHGIGAGLYLGASAAEANALALSVACSEGFSQRFCLNVTELNFCHNISGSETLSLEGPLTNATWVVTGLPPGMTLADSGTGGRTKILSGIPTTIGTFTIALTITDSPSGNILTKSFPVYIMGITNTTLPAGYILVPYDRTVQTTGFVGTVTFEITSGTLPDGLSIDSATGVISGTPSIEGAQTFTVTVTDDAGNQCSKSLTLTINPPAEITTASPLPEGTVGDAYSTTLVAIGVVSPLTWDVIAGSLPDGLTLNSTTGEISGTPTTADP